jgi:PAS domain S-box-containing protein
MGYEVPYIETTGEGAVKRALEIKPALILMDIILAGMMNGIEAAKQIRFNSDIPIIYLTAYSSENMFKQANITEPFGYLIKPIRDRELKSTIEIALYKSRMEKDLVRARKEWETIFDAIGQPAIILDSDHNIIEVNKATLTASRMSKEELLGGKCYEIFHKSNEPPESCPMTKVLQSKQQRTETMELEAFDRRYLISCTPIFDEEGRLEKVIHIATDITEHKKLED